MNKRALKACVFYCSNHVQAEEFASLNGGAGGDSIKAINMPCSGKVDVPYLMKAFETGTDGVVIVRCKTNECRHFEGNLRAHKRAEAVEVLLGEIGLGQGRMAVLECAEGGARQVLLEIKEFVEGLRRLPEMPVPKGQ